MTFPNGDKYVGEFAEGLFHGQGTYTLSNGQQYTGTWQEGKRHGQGTLTYPNGDTYVGAWQDDKRQGQGTYAACTMASSISVHGKTTNGMVKAHGSLPTAKICRGMAR